MSRNSPPLPVAVAGCLFSSSFSRPRLPSVPEVFRLAVAEILCLLSAPVFCSPLPCPIHLTDLPSLFLFMRHKKRPHESRGPSKEENSPARKGGGKVFRPSRALFPRVLPSRELRYPTFPPTRSRRKRPYSFPQTAGKDLCNPSCPYRRESVCR